MDPGFLSASERRDEYGVTEQLPGSMSEALAALDVDGELWEKGMGKRLLEAYNVLKAGEIAHVRTLDPGERIKFFTTSY